jgi:hypothetical protein
VVGTVIVPENADGKVRLALTGAVVEPGGVLQLNVAVDVRVGALDAFTVLVDLPDVRTVDVHLRTPVMLTPDSGVALPLSSGLRSIRLAADELVLAARDVMPATIAAFDTDVPAIELDFTSTALGSAGDLLVTQLNLTAVSSSKSESALGTIVSGFVVTDGEHEWGRSEQLVVGDTVASVMGDLGLLLEPGETRTLHVLLKLASGVQTGSVSVGLDLGGVVVRQPEGELVPVRVLAASGQIFPFLTLPGGVTPASLEQSYSNYPNPFAAGRETTTFVFGLAAAATVDLRIYTPRGELVRVLLDGEQRSVGLHQDVLWDGRNGRGDPVRNGVFIAEIIVRKSNGGFVTLRRKVAVVR